jgi:hypothetical protein
MAETQQNQKINDRPRGVEIKSEVPYYFFNHFPGSILIFADICFFRRYKAEPAY